MLKMDLKGNLLHSFGVAPDGSRVGAEGQAQSRFANVFLG